MTASFTHFFAVDWSARNKPSPARPTKDAIWVAEAAAEGRVKTSYFRTRHDCCSYMQRRLLALRQARVLVGWDFSFGYPEGTADALGLKGKSPWRAIWQYIDELVEDSPENTNNRFRVGARLNEEMRTCGGPFWGGGRGESGIFLGAKKDFKYPVRTGKAVLAERRLVEERHRKLQPAWKLAYVGSVGSQSLLGIPCVLRLRDHEHLREVSRVWPFEEVAAETAGAVVAHLEIYPSMLKLRGRDGIRDREQVRTYVRWLQERQAADELGRLLDRPWGNDIKVTRKVKDHEGWVLGL